ncbi:FAD-binding protein [Lutimaribacter sp. EGI FJ00015]|uniref:FAD-binding protein n=1 Tax=Lutimaribacter degradans TaxID=2945989 RepID=A0ACC5ZXZ8_9RHOB|nr:FAD-binding protein [Lutimaribacter sp. EGI FJ00013]MCM2563065.1 FAD-binding protein [Lutimaribacter sp. EGI FJ00013]MCO0614244.1 FAD-binding protein [Lutimaribacter sp. EGI FJ00015]MCO0637054.1 FAD-binding protein [Lutimaribacter sp. EGI FJ00014]
MTPNTEADLAQIIASAQGPLHLFGGGTRPIGAPAAGEALSLSALSGIVAYEPGALTMVARAGTPVAEIEAALAAEGQRLAFEPMDHRGLLGTAGTPTIGGVVAANVSGPRRVAVGACRDFLLGVRFVDGTGRVLKNGGRVMKNVTGYDLVKLLAGSYGTLGVLSELSLKVLPAPETVTTLTLHGVDASGALEAMTRAITSPFEVSGAAYLPGDAPRALLRIEGFAGSVGYRVERLKTLLADLGEITQTDTPEQSAAIWQAVRDVDTLADCPTVWRVSMTPGAMVKGLLPALGDDPGPYQLDWAGGLCWLGGDAGAADMHARLQALVADRAVNGGGGGHATLVKGDAALRAAVPVFQPEPAPVAALTRGLREKFDPKGILNPGLMG